MSWDPQRLPDQSGKTFVVTGGNAGLGYFTSEQLAGAGAHVVLACRDSDRAEAALAAIRGRVPAASVSRLVLDVSTGASVHAAAERLLELPRLDGLILNAGMVHPPKTRELSGDGHELVFETNYLGHVRLTALALPVLLRTPGSRVVSLGSVATWLTRSRLADLELAGAAYTGWGAYAQSKVATQAFGFELDRRLRLAGVGGPGGVQSLVAHPGYSVSGLTPGIRGVNEPTRGQRFTDNLLGLVMAQGKDRGAWPTVRAATDPDALGGQYYGPRFVTRGTPALQTPTRTTASPDVAARLWSATERLLGDPFPL